MRTINHVGQFLERQTEILRRTVKLISEYKSLVSPLSRQIQKKEQGHRRTNGFAKKLKNICFICAKRQLNKICPKELPLPLYSEQLLRRFQSLAMMLPVLIFQIFFISFIKIQFSIGFLSYFISYTRIVPVFSFRFLSLISISLQS